MKNKFIFLTFLILFFGGLFLGGDAYAVKPNVTLITSSVGMTATLNITVVSNYRLQADLIDINWGDGSTQSLACPMSVHYAVPPQSCSASVQHVYSAEATYSIEARACNSDTFSECDADSETINISQPPPSVCGNSIVEAGEDCDDGNLVSGDGCDSSCQTEGGAGAGAGPGTGTGPGTGPGTGAGTSVIFESPIGTTDFDEMLTRVLSWIWPISMAVAVLMVIIGAYSLVFSGGSPEKITTGRKIIVYALIGLAIITIARGIVALIGVILGL